MEGLLKSLKNKKKIITRCCICGAIKQSDKQNIYLSKNLYNPRELYDKGFIFSDGILSKKCYSELYSREDLGLDNNNWEMFLDKSFDISFCPGDYKRDNFL